MNLCRSFLKAARGTSPRAVRLKYAGAAVLGDGSIGYIVELRDGTQIETGRAHCAYCARAEAIEKLNAQE